MGNHETFTTVTHFLGCRSALSTFCIWNWSILRSGIAWRDRCRESRLEQRRNKTRGTYLQRRQLSFAIEACICTSSYWWPCKYPHPTIMWFGTPNFRFNLIEMTVLQQNKQRKIDTWKQAPCVTHTLSISRGILFDLGYPLNLPYEWSK